jgi:putative phosphoribosyl transferase
MRAAILSSEAQGAEKIVVATPVIAKDTLQIISNLADEIYYLESPLLFDAVGSFYKDFKQTTDEEVVSIMSRS